MSHSATGGTASLVEAALATVSSYGDLGCDVSSIDALSPDVDRVAAASGYLLATPANFGYMSGALKHFLDSVYYPLGDRTDRRPYGLIVKGSTDADGAVASVERIVAGLGWRQVLPPLVVLGEPTPADLETAGELACSLAGGLGAGLF